MSIPKKQVNSPITHFFPLITTVATELGRVNAVQIKNPVNSGPYKQLGRRSNGIKQQFFSIEKQEKSQIFRGATKTQTGINKLLGINIIFYILFMYKNRYKKERPCLQKARGA